MVRGAFWHGGVASEVLPRESCAGCSCGGAGYGPGARALRRPPLRPPQPAAPGGSVAKIDSRARPPTFPEALGALWSCKKMPEPSGPPVGRLKLMTPFPGVRATKNETSLADYADKICVVHLYTG